MTEKIQKTQTKNVDMSMFTKLGLKKSQLKNDAQVSIFNQLDKNNDGKLNFNEVNSVVTGKLKGKDGKLVTKQYVKVKDLENGRSLVVGNDGKEYVMAKDGTILKDSYVRQKNIKTDENSNTPKNDEKTSVQRQKQTAKTTKEQTRTINNLIKAHNAAQKAFDKQMADDGWAGDLADGVSVLWNSDNRATKVRTDLKVSKKIIDELKESAKQGEAQFKAKFKKIYGVEYNQKAIDDYNSNPTDENYQRAFGTKFKNITSRVENYNQSQQTGAAVVKTTSKVAAGVAVGVATGGTGFVALGVAAVGTAAASAAIEETDRMKIGDVIAKGKIEFREGTDHGQILKDAAWDGAAVLAGGAVTKTASTLVKGTQIVNAAGKTTEVLTKGQKVARAAATITGDVAVGAVQEKLQTGEVTLDGTLINATMSGVGSAAESGALRSGYNAVKKGLKKAVDKASDGLGGSKTIKAKSTQPEVTSKHAEQVYDADGNAIAGGLFGSGKGPGIYTKLKRAVGIEPDGMKALQNHNPVNYEAATERGLVEAVDNGKVSQKIYSDLQKDPGNVVSQRMLKALELEQQGKTLVTTVERGVSPSSISQYVGNGEVCSFDGRLFVNDNGKAVPIKLSQKKFEQLFPPVGTAMFYQPGGNVCPIVSQINTMMSSSSGRVALYSRFEQRGNDIYVHLANRETPIKFPEGKPADAPGARLGENAAPGIEMLNQAVLVNDMRGSGRVSNIEDLSPEKLAREAGDLKHSFVSSGDALGMPYRDDGVLKRHGLKSESPTWKSDVEKKLNSFKPGQDTMGAIWDMHAYSVVDYNPRTKTVTYHDPYNAGVDSQCPFDEFTSKANFLYHNTTEASHQSRVQAERTPRTEVNTTRSSQNVQSQPLQLQKIRIATLNPKNLGTVNGKPIIVKLANRIGDVFTIDINGKLYPMKSGQRIRISDEIKLKCDTYGVSAEIKRSPVAGGVSASSVESTSQQTVVVGRNQTSDVNVPRTSGKASIPIPNGYHEIGTKMVRGVECVQIQNANGSVLTEIDGKWKLLL